MHKTTKQEHNESIEIMKTFINKGDPKVGFFWYLPKENKLTNVHSIPLDKSTFSGATYMTLPELHQDNWEGEGNWMFTPRGRVFYNLKSKQFEIKVGSWIGEFPQAFELIKSRFNLNNVPVELIEDEHWDIGRGDSDF